MPAWKKPIVQLTAAEQQRVRDILGAKGTPTDALNRINRARSSKNIRPVNKSSVRRGWSFVALGPPKSNLPPCFRLRFQLPHAASRSYSVVPILPQLYGLVLSASQQPLDCGTHSTLTLRFGLEPLLMHIKPIWKEKCMAGQLYDSALNVFPNFSVKKRKS